MHINNLQIQPLPPNPLYFPKLIIFKSLNIENIKLSHHFFVFNRVVLSTYIFKYSIQYTQ